MLKAVKTHCDNAHVRGKARSYRYFVSSLFSSKTTLSGKLIWVNTGMHSQPRRSIKLAEADGQAMARYYLAMWMDGYGSLHNKPVY